MNEYLNAKGTLWYLFCIISMVIFTCIFLAIENPLLILTGIIVMTCSLLNMIFLLLGVNLFEKEEEK